MSKQKLSLQEQLLKSGLASSAQAKTVKSEKRKQSRQQRKNNLNVVDEAKELALKAQAEKAEKDRALNQLRKQQDEKKELVAQIKQLIELNRLPQDADGVAYNFTDHNKVKTLYVANTMRGRLIDGGLAIVKQGRGYEVVASEVADKISQRDPAYVIVHNVPDKNAGQETDGPYAAYQIPDDLVW